MSERSRTAAWARSLVEGLAAAGLREACIAPGSRSTPVVMALAREPRVRATVHLDERSAAFFALGVGKRSRRPAAVVTTSGTAVANLFPAVVEAAWSEAPLLLLTADRPLRLRGTDANQTIDQARIFGDYARLFLDAGPEDADEEGEGEEDGEREDPARLARRAWAAAVGELAGEPAGPVHLNLRFDKPLEPPLPGAPDAAEAGSPDAAEVAIADDAPARAPGAADVSPGVTGAASGNVADPANPGAGREAPPPDVLDRLADGVRRARRGLLVCGPAPDPIRAGAAALRLAEAAGWPVVADPLSGARFAPGARDGTAGAADLFLRSPDLRERLRPDLVLRLGPAPTSAALLEALETWSEAHQVIVHGGRRWRDHLGVASERARADAAATCDALAERLAGSAAGTADSAANGADRSRDPAWREAWRDAERAAREAIETELAGELFEGTVAADLAAALPEGATLFAGSSMPIRDLDAFAAARDEALHVVGNRGASGIDGSVSAALGAAASAPGPAAALIGDLAFLHDVNGLVAAGPEIDLVLVVVDNDGGGIFHMLPIREHEPEFTRYFATPHGLDLRRAAELHGLSFRDVEGGEGRDALESALTDALREGGVRILRVGSDRERNRARHDEVERAVREAVETARLGL